MKRKLTVSAEKLRIILAEIAIIIVESLIVKALLSCTIGNSAEQRLIYVSWLVCIAALVQIALWAKLTKELFSPYIVFFLVLLIFCCGQSVGWVLGLDMGTKDMWNRIDHGTTRTLLCEGLCYSILGISCFHLGAIIFYKKNLYLRNLKKWKKEQVLRAYDRLGKLLIIIVIPAFIAQMGQVILNVMFGGYAAYYSTIAERSLLMRVVSLIADFYQPTLLILLINYKNAPAKRNTVAFLMLLDVVANLYIGGRSGAVMTVLGILLAFSYFIRPFTKKEIFLGLFGSYIGMALLNFVAETRNDVGRAGLELITGLFSASNNVVGQFLGEIGWTVTSICWTMNLVPARYPFRHGMSYLVSLVSWIPTPFFGSVHPCVTWGNLGDWLQNVLGMSYGPGYSMVAESYINFGWFGLIALFVEGAIVVRLVGRVPRKHTDDDILGATFQIIVIMTIMKSLVRSSVSVVFRSFVFVILPIYILIVLMLKKKT